jgi:hypothetical protein
MKAADFLAQTQAIIRERGEQYGDPRVNMADTARRWSGVLGVPVTPAQVAVMMIELKLSRLKSGVAAMAGAGLDSMTDIAGYASILAELTTD